MSDRTSSQSLGEASVLVSFDYERAEPMTRDYPGSAACVIVLHAMVNGERVDSEYFADSVITRWEEAIAEEIAEEAETAQERRAEARAEHSAWLNEADRRHNDEVRFA